MEVVRVKAYDWFEVRERESIDPYVSFISQRLKYMRHEYRPPLAFSNGDGVSPFLSAKASLLTQVESQSSRF